ncbi:MAG: glycosyltransferase family 2 protein [Candidatus Omnitrophica bacterium]|nr:glycosyltransferase family 2 protein [Candidatus Omnitrophota bacterium]MCF7876983.1 glycosyltransferase family 2 protein [Candidatus Omnitrophota bacterium]MCF7878503.1 glycosyltransferase family 2 protein [Candidatus Omnitrophota bacterium]MCF7893156.1 glycosyltransferase family 2 protein [Candidatus Omnitrophota bacterium]
MNEKTSFSVIIPTYNRKDFLKIAIDSVLNQTYANYELIIIDDGSTDNTKDFIRSQKSPKLKYYFQENQGPALARNLGIKKAKKDFICFLDSDDRFRKDKLEITSRYIQKNPAYKIFHSQEIWYRNNKFLPQKQEHKKPSGFIFENAVKLCSISISTAAIKKQIFSEIGNFDKNLLACEDYDFWLRATLRYPVYLIPKALTIKEGGHKDQQSKKYPGMDKFRIYALDKVLQTKNINKHQHQTACRQLKEKCLIYIKGSKKRNKPGEIKKYQQILNKYSYGT